MACSEEEISRFVDVANKAADVAGQIVHKYHEHAIAQFPDAKKKKKKENGDGLITKAAKREAEEAMATIITGSFPTHVVFAEETGFNPTSNESSFVWVLDAIHGAREDFRAGFNLFSFGTMIALLYNGKPILGCIDQPIRKLRWMGVKGKPTTLNQEQVVAVACDDSSTAYANLKPPHMSHDARTAFNRLCYKVYVVLLDTTGTTYGALACGQLHLVVDCDVSPWNVLAAVPIVEGAGGVVTDWEGHELSWDGCQMKRGTLRVVAASDTKTHQEVIDSLSY